MFHDPLLTPRRFPVLRTKTIMASDRTPIHDGRSPQLLRQNHGQILFVGAMLERTMRKDIVPPDSDHIDGDAIIVIIPNAEIVAVQFSGFEVLQERVVFLHRDGPVVPAWTAGLEARLVDGRPVGVGAVAQGEPSVVLVRGGEDLGVILGRDGSGAGFFFRPGWKCRWAPGCCGRVFDGLVFGEVGMDGSEAVVDPGKGWLVY